MNKLTIKQEIIIFILINIINIIIAKILKSNNLIQNTLIFFVTYRFFYLLPNRSLTTKIKMSLIYFGILLYFYKNNIPNANTYFYYCLFFNILIMIIPPIHDKNYSLIFLIAFLSYIVPTDYLLKDHKLFNTIFCTILIQYYLFEHTFRTGSLLYLTTIIPMLLTINDDPMYTRAISLIIFILIRYEDLILITENDLYPKCKYFAKNKIKNNSKLGTILKKYNNRHSNKVLYYILFTFNCLLLFKYLF